VFLGRIVGSAWSTRKYRGLEGYTFLIVQPLSKHLQPVGRPRVAVDVVEAGEGDTVFLVRSREASLALDRLGLPVDLAIVGVVEQVDVVEGLDLEL